MKVINFHVKPKTSIPPEYANAYDRESGRRLQFPKYMWRPTRSELKCRLNLS
jgi:hypothetical protein